MEKIEFTPKQWVLVRDNEDGRWALAQFSNMWNDSYVVVGGIVWNHCIPYEGNEHLLGTTDDYVEPYEPKDGEFVYAKSNNGFPNNELVFIYHYTANDGKVYSYVGGLLAESGDELDIISINDDWIIWKKDIQEIRPATEEEKQPLLSKLAEQGKQWNPEKKCIEDVWKPKDGDFLISKKADYMFIYNERGGLKTSFYVGFHLSSEDITISEDRIYAASGDCIKGYRTATDDEIQMMLDALHKEGKDWNAEKKCVEDIWKPKPGDFVVSGWSEDGRFAEWVAIVKCVEEEGCNYTVNAILFLKYSADAVTFTGLKYDGYCNAQDYTRSATEEEKQQLLDAMHKAGKDWDVEQMKIVDYKWSPERLEEYHYCKFNDELNEFEVETTKNYELQSDVNRVKSGNCYKEWVDCSDRCDKMNKLLKGE